MTTLKIHSKKILCIEDNIEFSSITNAAKYYNIHASQISNYLHGKCNKLKINKRFIWKT